MAKMNGSPPPRLIKRLGQFDLDPCSPIGRPWDTAEKHLTIEDDGLNAEWPKDARVWCNPPYGNQCGAWMRKMAKHGNGIALTFARTETQMFFKSVWYSADAVLFIERRLKFYHVDGTEGGTAGAPSILIAYGQSNSMVLKGCDGQIGKYIQLK